MSMTAFGGIMELPKLIYGVGMQSGAILDAANEYVSFIIKFPKSGTLKKIGFHTGTVTTADTINVRIETVSDSDGLPTGTLYDANGTGSQADPEAQTVYWVPINGSSGISVTKGDIVAIKFLLDYVDGNLVIWYVVSNFNITNHASFPYVVTYLGGASSKVVSMALPLALEYDGEIVPLPNAFLHAAAAADTFKSDSTPNHRGLAITPPFACRAVGVWAYLDIDAAADLVLFGSDGATALQTISLPDPDIRGSTSAAPQYYLFTTAQNLVKGSKYRIVLRPATTTNVSGQYNSFTDDGALKAIDQMPLGQSAVYTTCNGTPANEASWTDDATKRACMGLLIDAVDIPTGGLANSILGSNIVRKC